MMKALLLSGCALVFLLAVSACDSPQRTLQQLQNDISAYAADPTPERADKIEAGFDRLKSQIGRLVQSGDDEAAKSLNRQSDALRAQYVAASMGAGLLKVQEAARGVGEAFRQAGQSIGETFKDGDSRDTD